MVKVASFGTKKALSDALAADGVKGSILSIGSDAKTVKGEKVGFKTGIVYMTPDRVLCPASKAAACEEGCLNTAGRAGFFAAIPAARSAKSALFKNNPELFFSALIAEIGHYSAKYGESFVVRLNGTSDITFEEIALEYMGKEYTSIFEVFPDVQFYDYTKRVNRAAKVLPANYDLTLSYSGARTSYAESVLNYAKAYGKRVAVVFAGGLPETFHGMPVVDGDETDLRFLDPGCVVVGLKAKGKARKDESGFVVRHAGLIAVA